MAYPQAPGGYGQPQPGFGQQAPGYGQPPAGFSQPPAAYGQLNTFYGQPPAIQQQQYPQQPQQPGQLLTQLPQQPGQMPDQTINQTFDPIIASTPISLPGQGPEQSHFPYPDSIMGQSYIAGRNPGYPQVLPTFPGAPGPYPASNVGGSSYFQEMGYPPQGPETLRNFSGYGRNNKKNQKKESEKTETNKVMYLFSFVKN